MTSIEKLLAESKRLRDEATPGPWQKVSDLPAYAICDDPGVMRRVPHKIVQSQNQANWKHSTWRGGIENEHNADFIVHACNTSQTKVEIIEVLITNFREMCEARQCSSRCKWFCCTTIDRVNELAAKCLEGNK